MERPFDLYGGLGSLPLLSDAKTRSISAENPDGVPGGGARAVPEPDSPASRLGQGWKVRPCITLEPQSTTTLADIEGPGVIQHIWITVRTEAYRSCTLRMYWDGEETPSVEVPLGDFFANPLGLRYNVTSLPIAVNPSGGFNSYWPLPFGEHARITIENEYWEPIEGFFYQITYALDEEVAEDAGYFHAQWRRSTTTRECPEHTILDGVRGQGHYVGTVVGWNQFSDGWWGEGEIKFYMDGDDEFPTICGTGTEDYFGGAWGFGGETFSTAFVGYPLYRKESGEVPKHGLYRWHVMDPIRFRSQLRVTLQALGWYLDRKFEPLTDDISSVACWYQREPHASFPDLPDLAGRWPR
ncbi:MAG: glycoside hydrolase family 172 protein [Anaerolineae bacterium]